MFASLPFVPGIAGACLQPKRSPRAGSCAKTITQFDRKLALSGRRQEGTSERSIALPSQLQLSCADENRLDQDAFDYVYIITSSQVNTVDIQKDSPDKMLREKEIFRNRNYRPMSRKEEPKNHRQKWASRKALTNCCPLAPPAAASPAPATARPRRPARLPRRRNEFLTPPAAGGWEDRWGTHVRKALSIDFLLRAGKEGLLLHLFPTALLDRASLLPVDHDRPGGSLANPGDSGTARGQGDEILLPRNRAGNPRWAARSKPAMLVRSLAPASQHRQPAQSKQ
jgi:hypothetical protein